MLPLIFNSEVPGGLRVRGVSAIRRGSPVPLAIFFLLITFSFCAIAQTRFNILTNGPGSTRLNIAVLSEGYTSSELPEFLSDATNVLTAFLGAAPYNEYRSYFNAAALFVASPESGSDHPAYPQSRQTYFNSSYDLSDRLLTIPLDQTGVGKVKALMNSMMPEADLTILIVNDLVSGGSGGPILITSRNVSSSQIVVHESGHTLAGLGDEYNDPLPGSSDLEEPNTTRQTNRNSIKWSAWISTNTPLPTPELPEYLNQVGLFTGAHYQSEGWYRPKQDCGMRHLGVPFCEVCTEALIRTIYKKVRSIEAYSPAITNFSLTTSEPLSFHVSTLQPASHSLSLQWFVNQTAVPGETNQSLLWVNNTLPQGIYSVSAEVRDLTPLVRNDPDNSLSNRVSWQIFKPFPESTPPIISISSPSAGARFTNSEVAVRGTARDNISISTVAFQLDNGALGLADGTTNWLANLQLAPGLNSFSCYSTDVSGNASSTRLRTFFYSVFTPVTFSQIGLGSVKGVTNGQLLEIGTSYRVKAKPAPGYLFAGWTTNVLSPVASLTFQMQSNLVLAPTFILNPFEPNKGAFAGWFYFATTNTVPPTMIIHPESPGLLSLKLSANGGFSGRLEMADGIWRFRGKFDLAKRATVLVHRTNRETLALNLELNSVAEKVYGTIAMGGSVAQLEANKGEVNAAPARYTFLIPGEDSNESPAGDGYGIIVIGSNAVVRTSGVLADGTRFSYSGTLLSGGTTRSFMRLDSGNGLLLSELLCSDDSIGTGAFCRWVKAANPRSRYYSTGFTNNFAAAGERYFVPSSSGPVFPATTASLIFQYGNLNSTATNVIHFEGNAASGTNQVSLNISPSSGLFKGKFLHSTTQRLTPIQGVVLQNGASGGGFFLGTNQSGRVELRGLVN